MQWYSADDIYGLADGHWRGLVDAAEESLLALAQGACDVPLRRSLSLSEGELLTMPGRLQGAGTAVVKLVTVVPGNSQRGLPSVQGVVVLFDAVTGTLTAIFDGAALTAVRTAAVSVAAIRRVSENPSRMALLGAGSQAFWHGHAFHALFSLIDIAVWSPTSEHRERLATRLSSDLHLEVRAMPSVASAVEAADVIVCCTTAEDAFLHADMLREGTVSIAAIGAYRPDMAEVGPSVFAEAGCVYVDDPEAAMHEAGDLLGAIEAGAIREADVRPVGGPIGALKRVRMFKSVGSAAEDAAAAAFFAEMGSHGAN